MQKDNIILIGMPGAGKSTIGPLLAENIQKGFLDTDTVIRRQENRELGDIVRKDGLDAFLRIQETVILQMDIHNHVIATGGGVVHNEAAMRHLKNSGVVIYLEETAQILMERFNPERKLARTDGKSFMDVFSERVPLYRKYADFTVKCTGRDKEMIVEDIICQINSIRMPNIDTYTEKKR